MAESTPDAADSIAAFCREQIREAVAGALEEAATAWLRDSRADSAAEWLRTRAAAIRRGEG